MQTIMASHSYMVIEHYILDKTFVTLDLLYNWINILNASVLNLKNFFLSIREMSSLFPFNIMGKVGSSFDCTASNIPSFFILSLN